MILEDLGFLNIDEKMCELGDDGLCVCFWPISCLIIRRLLSQFHIPTNAPTRFLIGFDVRPHLKKGIRLGLQPTIQQNTDTGIDHFTETFKEPQMGRQFAFIRVLNNGE